MRYLKISKTGTDRLVPIMTQEENKSWAHDYECVCDCKTQNRARKVLAILGRAYKGFLSNPGVVLIERPEGGLRLMVERWHASPLAKGTYLAGILAGYEARAPKKARSPR